MIVVLIIFLSATAFLIVLIYFLSQDRKRGEVRSFRQRFRERRRYPPPEQPIDPIFAFDEPSVEIKRDKPGDSKTRRLSR